MLMDGYESLYMEPIYMFPNSEHIFDEETEIMKKICSTPIILGGNELHNFSFVKSTENRMVQLSDVIIGIIGKLMLYANVSTLAEIKKEMASLSPQQEKNISLLNNLINASSDHCLAFIHYTANFFEMEKVTCILTMAKQKMPDASGHMAAASGILLAFSSILCYNYFYKFFQYTMEASYEIHRIAQPPYRDKLPCLWRIMEPRRY